MSSPSHEAYATRDGDNGIDIDDNSFSDSDVGLLEKNDILDPEAQTAQRRAKAGAVEYQVPSSTKYLFLGIYFALNLALTIYNKYVLGKVCLSRPNGSDIAVLIMS